MAKRKTKDTSCHGPAIKRVVVVKKGMAEKAFKKYLAEGNQDAIVRQILKGTVKVLQ